VKNQHVQGCSPRLCRLRIDGLAPRASIERTYRMLVYEPSKPSRLTSIEGCFTPTASLVGLEEKLGTNPQIGQPSWCGLGREPFFSGALALSIVVDGFAKGCYTWTA
jgi:hypothetical protein